MHAKHLVTASKSLIQTVKQKCGNLCNISLGSKSCTCSLFQDKAICHHLLAACQLNNVVPNAIQNNRKFITRRLRRIKAVDPESDEEEAVKANDVAQNELETYAPD